MSEPSKTPTADEVAKFWDAQAASVDANADLAQFGTVTQQSVVVQYRDSLERAHLAKLLRLRPDSRVLDLGGGAGRFALWLAPQVAQVTLVDVSAGLLQVAQRRAAQLGIHNLTTVHASAVDFRDPAGTQRYHAVLIMNVAAHLDDAGVSALATTAKLALAPGGQLYLKEPVSTDAEERQDSRSEPGTTYLTRFRPRNYYAKVFGRQLELVYQAPTCAHLLPWFVGSTGGAAQVVGSGGASKLLSAAVPYLVPVDAYLQRAEDALRARPLLSKLLAKVDVLQDLYVFRSHAVADTSSAPVLSVVVIAYNEAECIASVARELRDKLDAAGLPHELVLVDDGSSDATLACMRELAQSDARMQVVPLSPNRGIGGALRAGFDAASAAHITWVPGDGQISPEAVLELYAQRWRAPMLTTVYRTRDDAWYRHLISEGLNRLIQLRTGHKAKSGGNYLFERSLWQKHAPRADDSMMISTAFRHNLKEAQVPIAEIEIDARARVAGHSKVLNPKTILRTVSALLDMKK